MRGDLLQAAGRRAEAPTAGRPPLRLHELLLPAALLFGFLPAAPGISNVSNAIGVPAQGPLTLLWFVAVVARSGKLPALWLIAPLLAASLVPSLYGSDPAMLRAWVGVIAVPAMLFLGLVAAHEDELRRARSAVRWALFAVVAAQVFYFVSAVGVTATFSPSFVIAGHTNPLLWEQVGAQVLANPNNASVVFCTAFGWAVGERAIGTPQRLSWLFIATAATAVWVTGSRGALLTALAVVVVAVLFRNRSRSRVFAVLAMAAGAVWLLDYLVRTYAINEGAARSFETRIQTRLAALEAVAGSPLGSGPGSTSDTLRPLLGGVAFLSEDASGATSHDMFLNWGIGAGFVGLALLLVALYVGVRRSWVAGGLLTLLPLGAFVLAGQSAGVDILNDTNAAWATVLWALVGLSWRGSILTRPSGEVAVSEEAALDAQDRPALVGGPGRGGSVRVKQMRRGGQNPQA